MYRQKQGPLSPLSDTQYRSGGDSNGDSGISPASGVVYPIPASPRGDSSKPSIPLPTAAAFGRKASMRNSSSRRHSNNSTSRKEGSFSGTLKMRQNSFTSDEPALPPIPPSTSSSVVSPRQRMQSEKDETARKLKLLSFMGALTTEKGVVGS